MKMNFYAKLDALNALKFGPSVVSREDQTAVLLSYSRILITKF